MPDAEREGGVGLVAVSVMGVTTWALNATHGEDPANHLGQNMALAGGIAMLIPAIPTLIWPLAEKVIAGTLIAGADYIGLASVDLIAKAAGVAWTGWMGVSALRMIAGGSAVIDHSLPYSEKTAGQQEFEAGRNMFALGTLVLATFAAANMTGLGQLEHTDNAQETAPIKIALGIRTDRSYQI